MVGGILSSALRIFWYLSDRLGEKRSNEKQNKRLKIRNGLHDVDVLTVERRQACEHLVDERSEAPPVDCGAVSLSLQDLGSYRGEISKVRNNSKQETSKGKS
jgi:hypothetical protein